jgi:hypothetical protein
VRWAQDNLERLRAASPVTPSSLDDRAADAWEPLLAIADLAGEDWAHRARKAAQELSGEDVKEDDEIKVLLLADIRDIFETGGPDVYATKEDGKQIKSEKLIANLIAREDRPWAEFGRARKPITAIGLASLLRGYKIKPGTIRIGLGDEDTAKGYRHAQFVDVFKRYLPPRKPVTPSQSKKSNGLEGNEPVTPFVAVTDENAQNANPISTCDGVTVANGETLSSQHKCNHCKQYGETLWVAYDRAEAWLHRECMNPWRAAYDALDIRNQPFYRPEP